jgi:hypothetical protein
MARRLLVKVLALLLSAALLVSCNPFGLRDLLEAATRAALSIDPRNVSLPAGANLAFSASGGVPPYTYTTTNGGIDAATGEYTAPLSAGSATITVTDFAGATVSTGVTITELGTGLALSPSTLSATVNSSATFVAVGGTGPYTYSFQSTGSGSPDINPATGYYVAGSSEGTDVVRVTDALAATATANVTVAAVASAVNYEVTSTAALPASGVAGAVIPGGSTFRVTNVGLGGGAATVDWKVYLSADATLDGGDLVVKGGTTGQLASLAFTDVLVSGSWPAGPVGSGYLIVTVAAADDTSPGNNTSTPKAFTLQPRPVDYHVPSVNHTGGSTTGLAVNGNFTVENQLSAAGSSDFSWYVYASVDTTVGVGDYLLQWGSHAPLAGGGSDVISLTSAFWPTIPAMYRLLVWVSAADDTVGTNDTGWTSQVDVTGEPPDNVDYQAAAPVNTGGTVAGGAMNGTFQLTNTGSFAGSQTVYWTVFRSDDALLEVGTDPIAAMGSHAALGAGASTPVGYSGSWPAGTDTYFLFVEVSAIDDVDTSDNDSTFTMVGVTAPNVDYVVQSFSETSGAVAGDPITGTFQVRNTGADGGTRVISWTVYLSEDAILLPAGDLVVDAGTIAALGPGASSAVIPFDGTWPVSPYPPWTWQLYLVVDAADEVDPGDNTSGTLPRTTQPPNADYDVTAVSNTGGTAAGGALAGTFNATNLGPHDGTQAIPWRVYLSTDAVYDAGDTLADSGVFGSPGLTVGSFTGLVSFSGTWPTTAGTWYLVVVLEAGDDQNASNNWAASGPIGTVAPDVDYDVLAVNNTGPLVAGGALAGSFTVQNVGSDDGSRTVYWIAYRSDDLVLTPGTDPVVDSGAFGPLLGGDTAGPIVFTGAWPASLVPRTYYFFVRVLAADDTAGGNDTQPSGVVTVNPLNINYDVIVVNNTGPLVAGGALAGTFQVQNIGTANGSATLYWAVYRSLDLVYTPVVDPVIDSGSIPGGLTAGNSSNPNFVGTWPDSTVPVNYYYFVRVLAADDIASANDDQFSGMLTVAAGAPDYRVINQTVNGTGTRGAPLTGTNQFQIQNAAANPGAKTITWRAYASRDEILDGGDTLLSTNTTGPLAASATSANIPFSGTWPAFGSYYRIIVSVDADDDTNPANDTGISSDIEVPHLYTEGVENNGDSGPTPPAFSNVSDYAITLQVDQLVRINGTMDNAPQYDTYRITAGPAQTSVELKVLWATGFDDCDLYLWNESGGEVSSLDTSVNMEPDSPPLTIINLVPGSRYYIGVYFYRDGGTRFTPDPYQLYLYGLP